MCIEVTHWHQKWKIHMFMLKSMDNTLFVIWISWEMFEDNKGVHRNRKSEDRQHSG